MAAGWNKGKKWPEVVKQRIRDGMKNHHATTERWTLRPHKLDCRCVACSHETKMKYLINLVKARQKRLERRRQQAEGSSGLRKVKQK
jgi:hypothetical protein